MDIRNYQYLIQLQAMSMMSGGINQTSGLMQGPTFQSLLQAAMSSPFGSQDDEGGEAPMLSVGSNAYNTVPLSFSSLPSPQPEPVEKEAVQESTAPSSIDQLITKAAERFGVDERLVRAVVHTESNFKADATSHAGAQGLMQLMPATARALGVKNPFDAEDNLMGGTKYLKQMLDRYDGNKKLALAAYNAGPGNVDKYNGIPPFRETQNYVGKVLAKT
ncbi:lytic transglycosylase domain-containing protein [Halobacillus sp. KGW1]|uniref:lytic transglycosylase domain-containing protein n=1 Tax=Halobacillus sp. KGW1 TaxID=1793726 RepID=UPI000782D96F|nr:lytic transglycosylase domain-containing protein [Halobacillus sp. KGW1]